MSSVKMAAILSGWGGGGGGGGGANTSVRQKAGWRDLLQGPYNVFCWDIGEIIDMTHENDLFQNVCANCTL